MSKSTTRPFSAFEWMIALRYMRAKRAERFVSVISIISLIVVALGVATLIIVLAVMSGFRTELTSRILGINGHVRIEPLNAGIADYAAIAARLRAIPGITQATPLAEGQVLASQNGVDLPVNVRGISQSDLGALKTVSATLSPGALQRFGAPDTVIVGERLAQSMGLVIGGPVILLSADPSQGADAAPTVRTFTLAGTFRVGSRAYDEQVIFMPFSQAQAYFGFAGVASALEIMLAQPDRSTELVPAIQRAAGNNVRVLTWQETNSTFFGALRVERNVMAIILTLMIVLAAMNLVSSFVMLVNDKNGDIAILRSMGATQGTVMRIFFIAGAAIGVMGTVIGFVVGVVFCANFDLLRPLLAALFINPVLDPYEVTFVVVVALGLSFLATLIPSWRAARLDPVEALRYE